METILTDARGMEAVNPDTAGVKIAHKEIAPNIHNPAIKRFNAKFGVNKRGMGKYNAIFPVTDQILYPTNIGGGVFKLFDMEDIIGRPESYPAVSSIIGIVGYIILQHVGGRSVVRELDLLDAEAFNHDGTQVTPADYFRYCDPDSLPIDKEQSHFRHIYAPLKGAVVLNLIKIQRPDPKNL